MFVFSCLSPFTEFLAADAALFICQKHQYAYVARSAMWPHSPLFFWRARLLLLFQLLQLLSQPRPAMGVLFLRMVFTLPTVRERIPARSAIFSRMSIGELCANLPNPYACHQRSGWQCGSVTQVLLLNADVAVGYTWPRLILSISAIVQSLASLALLPDSRARALLISAGRIQILANHSYGHFRSHK